MAFRYHIPQYLKARADWHERGFAETLVDFPALNARSKFWGDDQRAWWKNWEEVRDMRNPLDGRQRPRAAAARAAPPGGHDGGAGEPPRRAGPAAHPLPPGRIGHPIEPGTPQNLRLESFNGPNAGLTEVLVPAGYVRTAYDPRVRAERRPDPVPADRVRRRHRAPRAGAAVLARLPCRARDGGPAPARGLELRVGLPAADPAARLRGPSPALLVTAPVPASAARCRPVPCRSRPASNPLLSQWVGFGRSGHVEVRVGKVELGQGIVTALGQIAAEELDVAWSRVHVVPASTDGSPDEVHRRQPVGHGLGQRAAHGLR